MTGNDDRPRDQTAIVSAETATATKNEVVAQKKPAGPVGEPERPDPTRYGDWEKNGRCIDF